MPFATNVQNLATRMATEAKALRTLINGNAAGLAGLSTTAKTDLVAAINELAAELDVIQGGGVATDLESLSDVDLTAPVAGHILRHDGTKFVNVLGTTHYEVAGAGAAAQAASQPRDSDLTAIAALTTTTYGRAFLALADQTALMALVRAATETVTGVVELASTAEATTGTDATRAVTPAGLKAATDALRASILGTNVPAALDTLDELAAALGDDANFASTVTTSLAGKQPLDATLTALASLATVGDRMIYATGTDTFALATLTAFARTLLDDADAATARTTLDVYSKTEIGNPETDFVATFEAGLI